MHVVMHMRRFYFFIFAVCLLIAAYPGREFVIRPNNVTILSWMRDQTITVVPVADLEPPVVEVEDVDQESILLEPDTRVRRHEGGRFRRRQGGGLQHPAGRHHARDTGESHYDAQKRPVHGR